MWKTNEGKNGKRRRQFSYTTMTVCLSPQEISIHRHIMQVTKVESEVTSLGIDLDLVLVHTRYTPVNRHV